MWTLLKLKIPVWVALILLALLGIAILGCYLEFKHIESLNQTIAAQKIEIAKLEERIKEKDEHIDRLNKLYDKNADALVESQKRTEQALKIAGSFGKPVPLPIVPGTPMPMGVVQLRDSAKVVDWINREILQ